MSSKTILKSNTEKNKLKKIVPSCSFGVYGRTFNAQRLGEMMNAQQITESAYRI